MKHDHNHDIPSLGPLGCALVIPVISPIVLVWGHLVVHVTATFLGVACP